MPQGIVPTLTSFFGATLGANTIIATAMAHLTVAAVTMVGANLLAPKVDFGGKQNRRTLNVRGQNQRNATSSRQYVYGEIAMGGTVAYMGTSGTDNEFLHMVLVHCDHEVESLGDLYVNGELVPLAAGGEGVLRTTTDSRFAGSLYIADHFGGPTQTAALNAADTTLDAAMGQIYDSDAFEGMAYTYIRMELKQPTDNDNTKNAFSSGVPQFQRVIQGMKVYDPREVAHDPDDSTTWEYSANWALCVAHFLQSEFGYGRYGLSYDEINETELIASANDSDTVINELWTAWGASEAIEKIGYTRSIGSWLLTNYGGTGTTDTVQPDLTGLGVNDTVVDNDITWTLRRDGINSGIRYELNGMVDSSEDPIEVVRKMKTAAGGMVEFIGGEWFVRSGRYIVPTITLSEGDFTSGISGTTKDDRTNAVNTVKGVIVDKLDSYNVIDAPSITNATYITEDGGVESVGEMELMFTNSHKVAQRLFKIQLNKSRQSISHSATFTSKAMQLQVGDIFKLNFDRYGYVNKEFEVYTHQLLVDSGSVGVNMEFREVASNMYDWDHTTDETALDPAPNTTLPSAFEVAVPTNLATASGTAQLVEKGGRVFSRMRLSWDLAADSNVIAHEVIWRKREYRAIDNITQANPAVVTTGTAHDFVAGDVITMWGVTGMTEVVGIPYTVANPTSTTLELSGIDSTSYGAYSAGADWIELDWENSTYVPVPSSTITLPDVEDGAGYDFKVRAINTTTKSDWVALDNQVVVGKTAAPTIPTWSDAVGLVEAVKLTMDEHPDADFKQFLIFQNTTNSKPGAHSYTTTDTTKTITGLTAGQEYFFWLEAEDTTGNTTAAAAGKSATPSTFASDFGSNTLSVQMEVGQSGIPTDWTDFDMSVDFYVEGASATYTASTPTAAGEYTITGESATPSGVTMKSSGSYPTVGVTGWPVGFGDFIIRKSYYVQYMDASGTLRNFSIDREWHRTQRFVLGPPRFNPTNEPDKGGTGLAFKLNYTTAVSANDGEIFVGGTTFTKPDGTTTTGISENYVGTPYEGGISPTTGTVGDFFLMWTDTAADTRFSPLTFTHQNVVPIKEAAAGGYEVFNNAGTTGTVTFATTDVLLAAVWRDDSTTGLTGIERYVDANPGQSENFVTGTSGYKIDSVTGDAEFNDVTVRGTIDASTSADSVINVTNGQLDYNGLYFDDTSSSVAYYGPTYAQWAPGGGQAPGQSIKINKTEILVDSPTGDSTYGLGIVLEDDVNLYRDSADVLKTDDTLIVGTDLQVDGDVGIGTASPSEALEVVGNAILDASNAELNIKAGATGTTGAINFTFNTDTTNYAGIDFAYDTRATIGPRFWSTNGYDLSIDSGGEINLQTDSATRMTVSNTAVNSNLQLQVTNASGIQVGSLDSVSGQLTLYGGSAHEGGQIDLQIGATADTTWNAWKIDAYNDDLRFFVDTNVVMQIEPEDIVRIYGELYTDGAISVNGTERLPATKPTVADAEIAHTLADLGEVELACDDLGTKINSILSYLNL